MYNIKSYEIYTVAIAYSNIECIRFDNDIVMKKISDYRVQRIIEEGRGNFVENIHE
jgi:hypothetical protein